MSDRDVEGAIAILESYFDDEYYKLQLALRGLDLGEFRPVEHYIARGKRMGLDPSVHFSTNQYLEWYEDVARIGMNPFWHYLSAGMDEGRVPYRDDRIAVLLDEFDVDYYNEQVRIAGLRVPDTEEGSIRHYLVFGHHRDFDPNRTFSTSAYKANNDDVVAAGINAFWHYIAAGRAEGRSCERQISEHELEVMRENLDAGYYAKILALNGVAAGEQDLVEHFCATGWRQLLDPRAGFSVRYYLDANPDVKAAGINPFYHYLLQGIVEGRLPKQTDDPRISILEATRPVEVDIADAIAHYDLPKPDGAGRLRKVLSTVRAGYYLTVSHDNFAENVGGVQLCIMAEQQYCIGQGVDHVHLYPARPLPTLSAAVAPIGVVINGVRAGIYEPSTIAKCLTKAPSRATVHSLIGHHAESIVTILRSAKVEQLNYWIHDYSSVCAGFTLLRNDVRFCGAPPITSNACGICRYGGARRLNADGHKILFDNFRIRALAPSATAANVWKSTSGLTCPEILVREHASLIEGTKRAKRKADRLRIGFLGLPRAHKGWSIFRQVSDRFAGDPRFEFFHLGKDRDGGFLGTFVKVQISTEAPDAMVRAVKDCALDVAVIWSNWPETFCFTAYEALAGGACVLTNGESGNVARLAGEAGMGRVFADEVALAEFLESADAEKDIRAMIPQSNYSLKFADPAEYLNLGAAS